MIECNWIHLRYDSYGWFHFLSISGISKVHKYLDGYLEGLP